MYHKLVIDNFAGGGGGSTGIEAALGRPVDVAINHCRYALGMHRINHPFTEHLETDVFDVDPPKVTKGLPIGLVHSSPDCRFFSKAKNGPLDNAKIRGLTPRELFRAQGFPEDYVIDRAWVVDKHTGKWREVKLTKAQQIRMCGNSVCPTVMEALIKANVPDMIESGPPRKWRPNLEVMRAARIAA